MKPAVIIALLSLLVSIAAFFRESLLGPEVKYSLSELTEYPRSDKKLSLRVKRAELADFVELKYGVIIHLRSTGWKAASNVQTRIKAEGGSVIVQAHREDNRLVQDLPDIGRQGSSEVFITIPLMVPGEETKLTFWYGIPGTKTKPPLAAVLVRHSEGLGRLYGASSWEEFFGALELGSVGDKRMNWGTVLADSRFWLEAVILFTATFTGIFLSFLLERKRSEAQDKETFGKVLQSVLLESANNHGILNNIEGTVTVGATPAFEINISALQAALDDPLFHRWAEYSLVKTALVVRTNLGSINNFLSFYRLAAASANGLTAKGARGLQIRAAASRTMLEILQKQLDKTMPKFNATIVRDSASRNVDESLSAALREEKAKLEELDRRLDT